MSEATSYFLTAVGFVQSSLKTRREAPKQGNEEAPDAWVEIIPSVERGLQGIEAGQDLILITWLHESRRDILKLHPRGDKNLPVTGVFATRSPDRPNPLGLHRVKVLEVVGNRLRVGPLEAIDGTPIVDIKPVLSEGADS
jgi:tRNA-Thr(GGU) m(6)t(6)A37 methyltransferase TsaA